MTLASPLRRGRRLLDGQALMQPHGCFGLQQRLPSARYALLFLHTIHNTTHDHTPSNVCSIVYRRPPTLDITA
ncbi:MAG TPA: hypothetical protein VK024_04935 [Actinomycetaceae bacterium]|nr:hypothetical protein [Actinomycetaceae bacterium]